ncbi:MAG: glycosyltransferase, partial [Candidatus Subteraquimicrobiales bacterium]|nr:glycosyltransferase [Candidatus Subteraquimicrobiales bacterium]
MSRKINVLLVNKLYYPVIGGVENHVRDLAINLSKNLELNVRVLVANTSFKTELQEIDGVEVYKIASLGTFRSTPISPSFLFWLRKLKSDIYHFHFPYPFGEFSYLLAKSPGKLVVTYHSDIIRQKLLLTFYKPFLKAFLKKADEILVGSPNLIKHSVYLSEVKEKCALVHYGIDTKRFELTESVLKEVRKLRNCYGNKIVLFIGRLIYYKGIEYLLRAMKDVDGVLLLVGKGPLEDSLRELAKDL